MDVFYTVRCVLSFKNEMSWNSVCFFTSILTLEIMMSDPVTKEWCFLKMISPFEVSECHNIIADYTVWKNALFKRDFKEIHPPNWNGSRLKSIQVEYLIGSFPDLLLKLRVQNSRMI